MPATISRIGSEQASERIAERTSQNAFLGMCALLFAVSTTATIVWCTSMSAVREMRMPGGPTMSMTWTRMADRTWAGAATSFVAMWVVMMVAMMLPSLVPMLLRYRHALDGAGKMRIDRLTVVVGLGYFFVWALCGAAVFPLGVAVTAAELRVPDFARAVPLLAGVVILVAGTLQLTAWKAHHLDAWREAPEPARALSADDRAAWRLGMRLGLHCFYCCVGPTAVLLVLGVMDLRAMAVVTAAVGAERLAPAGERVARGLGVLAVGAGLVLIARAAGM